MIIPGLPTGGPFGKQELVYNDEFLSTETGQIDTQFDGPNHIGIRTSKGDFFYNDRMLFDLDVNAYGLGSLGVEHVAKIGFVCGGVVLGTVAYWGKQLPIPRENNMTDTGIITVDDVKAVVKAQGIDPISEGDCVFLYTGHRDIWHPGKWDENSAADKTAKIAKFNSGEPGFGTWTCDYMAEQKIILWGTDTWDSEAVGKGFGGETPQPFECHIRMMAKNGIWNLENMDLSQLIADKAYEFLFA